MFRFFEGTYIGPIFDKQSTLRFEFKRLKFIRDPAAQLHQVTQRSQWYALAVG